MAQVGALEVPPELLELFQKLVSPSDTRRTGAVRKHGYLQSREKIYNLTTRSLLPDIRDMRKTLLTEEIEVWKQAAAAGRQNWWNLFVQDTAFLLTVGSHKDIHVDSGNSIVFSALQDEFPSEVDNFFPELKGVLPEQPMASVPDRLDMAKTLKSAGVNSFFADQQGLVRLFGMGITSARTPVATTRFIHKVNNEIVLFFLKNSVGKWFDSPIRIVSLERIDAIPHLIVNQRDDFGRLCFTFMRLNEQHNTTRLIDMLDAVYFSQGVQRKSLAKKIRQNHHRGLS